jgi:diguanylate cyclase (GGDEF)-like protein
MVLPEKWLKEWGLAFMGDRQNNIRLQLGNPRRVIGGSFAIGGLATLLTAFICYFGYALFQPEWLQSSIGMSVPLVVPALVAPPVAALVFHFSDIAAKENAMRKYLAQELTQETRRRRRLEAELARLSKSDPVTGLVSRDHLWDRAKQAIARAQRHKRALSLATIAIDNFADLNQKHGHATADKVLREVAAIFLASVRDVDVVGRATDDTFALLLEDTDLERAEMTAIRLRRLVNNRTASALGPNFAATVSMGVVEIDPTTQTFDSALTVAEEALQAALKAGMGQICLISEPVPPATGEALPEQATPGQPAPSYPDIRLQNEKPEYADSTVTATG